MSYLSWCGNIEGTAMDQIDNICSLPFLFHHAAIMPDCHAGYGVPIGTVLPTVGVVLPGAVGVDIGCGVCAIKSTLKEIDRSVLERIIAEIKKVIPVGFSRHKESQGDENMPELGFSATSPICTMEYDSASTQMGTLGGGNHFIEIQKDEEGFIWIMIHSGSRNIGLKVANHYSTLAKNLNKKYYSVVDTKKDLAFLDLDSNEGYCYMQEMNFCLEFAFKNRKLMLDRVKEVFDQHTDVVFFKMINIHHNYAALENHFGKNIVVHRKGATRARVGDVCIIPGSQGTSSYIADGLGCKKAYCSCSHGAGRLMSRKKAKALLDLEAEQKRMDDLGIIHGIKTQDDLDECSSVYKDIDDVMDSQKDLVKIVTKLSPLAVIKG